MKPTGIDVGYGFTKATDGPQMVVFPSLVGPAEAIDFDAGLANGKGLTLAYGDRTYFVGERAALQSRWQSRTLSRERVTTDEAKILFLAGLVHLYSSGYVNGGLSVVTGLPIAWMEDSKALSEAWQGEHLVRLNGKPKRLQYNVSTVEVTPQAWGTLVREMVTPDGKKIKDRTLFDGDVVIIDFGTRNVNFLAYSQREYIQHESASLNDGMERVLEVLQREILRVYGLELPLHGVDEALRKRAVTVYGEVQPIHDLVKPVVSDITDRVVAQARTLWQDGKSKGRVLLTGGGAIALGKEFAARYGHPRTSVVHDAQTANAQGLYLWALMKENFSHA